MADPLSVTASIIAVIQVSTKVIKYINGTTGAKKDRKRLREEVWACEVILQQLQHEADDLGDGDRWAEAIEALEGPNAPLGRLFIALDVIKAKLQPEKSLLAVLRWPFDEREIEKLISAIEREKSLLQLALTNDFRYARFHFSLNTLIFGMTFI